MESFGTFFQGFKNRMDAVDDEHKKSAYRRQNTAFRISLPKVIFF
jgi:hypothetical protein